MLVLHNVMMELSNVRKKSKGTTKCEKKNCHMRIKPSSVRKNKGTTQCDKRTVTCEVGTAQCEDGTVKIGRASCRERVLMPV